VRRYFNLPGPRRVDRAAVNTSYPISDSHSRLRFTATLLAIGRRRRQCTLSGTTVNLRSGATIAPSSPRDTRDDPSSVPSFNRAGGKGEFSFSLGFTGDYKDWISKPTDSPFRRRESSS